MRLQRLDHADMPLPAPHAGRAVLMEARRGAAAVTVTLPLSLGIAFASGLPAAYGVYSAAAGTFVASVVSWEPQIIGPSAAFVAIVPQVLGRFGAPGLALCMAAAGLWMLLFELAALTPALARIPPSGAIGLRNAIALAAAVSLVGGSVRIEEDHPAAIAVAVLSLLMSIGCHHWVAKAPAPLFAIATGALVAHTLHLRVTTLASAGQLPGGIPLLRWPAFDWSAVQAVTLSALGVAVLAGIETVGQAPLADYGHHAGRNHRFVAVALANIACSALAGPPATPGTCRTVPSRWSNPRTPVAGVVHAGALVGAVLVLHPLLGGVPVSVLCAVVAAELLRAGGWRETLKIVDHPSANRWRWLAAFLGVVVLDLPAAMALVLVIAADWAYRRSRRDARRIVPSRPHRIH